MMPATALAANAKHACYLTAADPVFAAIERHHEATQARSAEHDDEAGEPLMKTESDVASRMADDTADHDGGRHRAPQACHARSIDDIDYANLAESASIPATSWKQASSLRR
jgi:hypothetical protein